MPSSPLREARRRESPLRNAQGDDIIRQAARGSADLLIVPVNDWLAVKDLHFQMHAFRAIETGVPLVRAAASGLSSAFDPWGRVLGVTDFFAPGDRTLTVQVPMGRVRTLYALTGDLFAWLCVAGLVVAIGVTTLAPLYVGHAITGRAIYEGTLDFAAALKVASGEA